MTIQYNLRNVSRVNEKEWGCYFQFVHDRLFIQFHILSLYETDFLQGLLLKHIKLYIN
jgi:hypothetical protein